MDTAGTGDSKGKPPPKPLSTCEGLIVDALGIDKSLLRLTSAEDLRNLFARWLAATEACEQLNAWLGGFESILKRMTSKNFNWFLHVMLVYHVKHVLARIKAQEDDEDDEELSTNSDSSGYMLEMDGDDESSEESSSSEEEEEEDSSEQSSEETSDEVSESEESDDIVSDQVISDSE